MRSKYSFFSLGGGTCAFLAFFLTSAFAHSAEFPQRERQALLNCSRQTLDRMLGGTRPIDTAGLPSGQGPWTVAVTLFDRGSAAASVQATDRSPAQAIRSALQAVAAQTPGLLPEQAAHLRFRIRAEDTGSAPHRVWDLVEYRGRAVEIATPGDVTAVRTLDARRVRQTIREQKNYLLRHLDPRRHALFKRYDALTDTVDPDLRTIYTASGLWTLLQMNDLEPDERIARQIRPMADFLLDMQEPNGDHRGAFYYSVDRSGGVKRERFVVGTASKTIFTLLELHRRGFGRRYLESAELAGDWLVRQTRPDGSVDPVVFRDSNGGWKTSHAQSVLYSGQTLTALSRLFEATHKPGYRAAADRIAQTLLKRAQQDRFFVGDDFRSPNTVSTSWLAMAFLSYSRISDDPVYRDAVHRAARALIDRQIRDFSNVLDDGRYADTWASSGNGWINEVLVEVYRRSLEEGRDDRDAYLDAITHSSRWLIQNVYSYENSYHIPNPARARGGSIRNSSEEAVRTDAVCHGGNSLIGYWRILKDDIRLSIPEIRSL